jgi:hypothetical protein
MARSEGAASFAFISIDSIIPQGDHRTLLSLPCAEIWRILLAEAASKTRGKTPWEPPPPLSAFDTTFTPAL